MQEHPEHFTLTENLKQLGFKNIEYDFPLYVGVGLNLEGGCIPINNIGLQRIQQVFTLVLATDDKISHELVQNFIQQQDYSVKPHENLEFQYKNFKQKSTKTIIKIYNKCNDDKQYQIYKVSIIDECRFEETVDTMLIKIPIYDITLWLSYHILNSFVKNYEEIKNNPCTFDRFVTIITNYTHLELDIFDFSKISIQNLIQSSITELEEMIYNINNKAYMNAIGYYFMSLLNKYLISPISPQIYLYFKAYDNYYFKSDVITNIDINVNKNFPVEAMFIQKLNKNLNQMILDGEFYNINGNPKSGYDYLKIKSMMAQIIFGLDAAQEIFGLVHNNLTGKNIMCKKVSQQYYLFYHKPNTDLYWAIPSFGKIYKIVNYQSATLDFDDINFGGEITYDPARIHFKKHFGSFNFNTDLYDFCQYLVSIMKWVQFLNIDIENIYPLDFKSIIFMFKKIFSKKNKFKNSIPKDYIYWFSNFQIAKTDVPEDAAVYIVFD
jgi:hypothetical protein